MKDMKLKVGDVVYWGELKGEVVYVDYTDIHYEVNFIDGRSAVFSRDGYFYYGFEEQQLPLSFTPYTVKFEGITRKRPLDNNKVVYVRDSEDDYWEMRFPSHFDEDGNLWCFEGQRKEGAGFFHWAYHSFTNPLENEK